MSNVNKIQVIFRNILISSLSQGSIVQMTLMSMSLHQCGHTQLCTSNYNLPLVLTCNPLTSPTSGSPSGISAKRKPMLTSIGCRVLFNIKFNLSVIIQKIIFKQHMDTAVSVWYSFELEVNYIFVFKERTFHSVKAEVK